MCKLVLDKGSFVDFTSVSNVFIDEYMPKANGEFVKIYLHLLRLISDANMSLMEELSTEKIADKFNLLESDVMRALRYWADQGLLSLTFNQMNEVTGITLESAVKSRFFLKGIEYKNEETLAKASGDETVLAAPTSCGVIVPTKKRFSAKDLSSFSNRDELNHLLFLAENYLEHPLSNSEINSVIYMLRDLQFSSDFVEYLFEDVLSSNDKSMNAIEKQALEFFKKNIFTIEEAKMDSKLRSDIAKSIYKIFGNSPSVPIKKEMDFITKWTGQYGFSDDIILEACNRTMEHTHKGSFKYADGILKNWFENNANSLESIEKLDKAHAQEIKQSTNNKFSPKNTKIKKIQSFDQRTYDYDDLELQLIAKRNSKHNTN